MTLEEIYASLPQMQCQAKCQECCGIIPIFPAEKEAIASAGQQLPVPNSDMSCKALSPFGTCKSYSNRPLICRLWGLVPEMACPFGCRPERWLTEPEVKALFAELKRLSGGIGAEVLLEEGKS